MATSIIGGNYIRKSGGGGGGENPQPSFTGHVDVEGLKSLGWDDEDIEGFQTYGVFWNEEDDELYKVQSNDSRYLRADNTVSVFRNNAVIAIPKLQNLTSISGGASLAYIGKQSKLTNLVISFNPYIRDISYLNFDIIKKIDFDNCISLQLPKIINIPVATTFNITNCPNVKTIESLQAPLLSSQKSLSFEGSGLESISLECEALAEMYNTFLNCTNLKEVVLKNISKVSKLTETFKDCKNLKELHIPTPNNITNLIDTLSGCIFIKNLTGINSNLITGFEALLDGCANIDKVEIDMTSTTYISTDIFRYCTSLADLKIKSLKHTLNLKYCPKLSKESLIYIINNAAPTSNITIQLDYSIYNLYKDDPEVISALEAQPLISLGQ